MWKARFRSLIIGLLIVGFGGAAQARPERFPTPSTTIVYFVDGTRMEVRAFEIQGEIVVLMTLDGKLESVPRSFVDLDVTSQKKEARRQTPEVRQQSEARSQKPDASGEPETGGQRPEVSSGDGAIGEAPGRSNPTGIDGPSAPVPPDMVNRDDQGHATMRAVRLEAPLVLDGKLDESIYHRVAGVAGFLQAEPDEGAPATEKTEAWVLFDDENLYIVGRCWDSHPERIVANEMRRDNFGIYLNDNFAVVLDTFYDRRNAFFFYTNPVGGLFDGLITDERDVNRDWNTVWNAKTGRFENGWTVEMAIPFKSLRYSAAGSQIWGINFRRIVRSKNEFSYLPKFRLPLVAGALRRSLSLVRWLVWRLLPSPIIWRLSHTLPVNRSRIARPIRSRERPGWRLWFRRQIRVDAQSDRGFYLQYRFRSGGNRRATDQLDPLQLVLARETGVLFGRPWHLPVRWHRKPAPPGWLGP